MRSGKKENGSYEIVPGIKVSVGNLEKLGKVRKFRKIGQKMTAELKVNLEILGILESLGTA